MRIVLQGGKESFLRCSSCHVVFRDPQPQIEEMTDDFVERHITSDERLESFASGRDPVLKQVADRITRDCSPGKILDVGCAGGYFLERFLPSPSWEKFGAEASRFAASRAAKKGIEVWQGMFASLNLPESFFDVVTLLDILYYFREPQRELRLIRKAIKPSGVLWIEMALGEAQIWRSKSILARVSSPSRRSVFASNYLFLHNLSSLAFLLRETGFRVAETIPVTPPQHRNAYANFVSRSFYYASKLSWTLSLHRILLGPRLLVKAVPVS